MKFAKLFDLPEDKQLILIKEHPTEFNKFFQLTQLHKQTDNSIIASTMEYEVEEEINKEFDAYTEEKALTFLNEYVTLYNEQKIKSNEQKTDNTK